VKVAASRWAASSAQTRRFFASHAYKMAEVTEITEGMRVIFDETGTVYLRVGHNEHNFHFQDEN